MHLHPVMYTFLIGIAPFNWSCNVSRYTVDPDREGSLFIRGMKAEPCRIEFKSFHFRFVAIHWRVIFCEIKLMNSVPGIVMEYIARHARNMRQLYFSTSQLEFENPLPSITLDLQIFRKKRSSRFSLAIPIPYSST